MREIDFDAVRQRNKEIVRIKNQMENARDTATRITAILSGMPSGGGKSDKLASCAADLADLQKELERKEADELIARTELILFIENMDDPIMRQILQYRCINNLEWEQVAESIGGNNTAGSVRTAYCRFRKSRNTCNTGT